jgi:hypothetical protein
MAKEKVKHLSGVFASVFAHHGHITRKRRKKSADLMILNSKKHMTKHPTSLIRSCSMKARRWISSWNILPKKLINISITMAGNCSNKLY